MYFLILTTDRSQQVYERDEVNNTLREPTRFGRLSSGSRIGDLVWNDTNMNGVQDAGEPGIEGLTVRLHRVDDVVVESTTTDAQGHYAFADVPAGDYVVEFVSSDRYSFTALAATPDDTLDSDAHPRTGRTSVFSVEPEEEDLRWDAGVVERSLYRDWGDAPEPRFLTTASAGGASHRIVPGFSLGPRVDAEPDGQPKTAADGDDRALVDDEDGVRFTSALVPGHGATLEVTSTAMGALDAWIDFGRDGVWNEPVDRVFGARCLEPGVTNLTFAVPSSAVLGPAASRFRLSKAGGLSVGGSATEGEVEDYFVEMERLDWGDAPDVDARSTMVKLTPSDSHEGAKFGRNSAFSGQWLAVGARLDSERATEAGAVYMYRQDGSSFVLHEKLSARDTVEDLRFGTSVGLEGDWLVASSARAPEAGEHASAIHFFQWDGAHWSERQKLPLVDAFSENPYVDVSLAGEWAMATAPQAVYVFRRDRSTWSQTQVLRSPAFEPGASFRQVVLRGEWAFVSYTADSDLGVVAALRRAGLDWSPRQRLQPTDLSAHAYFGSSLGIAPELGLAMIGAYQQNAPLIRQKNS
ncbi:MAG: SdrD B-like domain-containing protein [Verrucomicrobiia bacterium]